MTGTQDNDDFFRKKNEKTMKQKHNFLEYIQYNYNINGKLMAMAAYSQK